MRKSIIVPTNKFQIVTSTATAERSQFNGDQAKAIVEVTIVSTLVSPIAVHNGSVKITLAEVAIECLVDLFIEGRLEMVRGGATEVPSDVDFKQAAMAIIAAEFEKFS